MPGRLAPLLATLGLGACTALGVRSGTEEPPHAVVDRLADGRVEVRRYGDRLAAETTVAGEDGARARNEAFALLAGYIFGENRPRAEVAMTVPVAVERDGGGGIATTAPAAAPVATDVAAPGRLVMRFFMPAGYTRATLPEPADPRVRIVDAPGDTVAVLRFAGSTGRAAVAAREAELRRALADSAWRPRGPAVAWFYDPPWTIPFLRRNEVVVPVEEQRGAAAPPG